MHIYLRESLKQKVMLTLEVIQLKNQKENQLEQSKEMLVLCQLIIKLNYVMRTNSILCYYPNHALVLLTMWDKYKGRVKTLVNSNIILTLALANWGSLHFTSARERQSKSLINGNSESGTTIKQGAKALWWRLDNGWELWATWRWWGWRTSHYVVEARAQASQCIGATWLGSSILSPHSGHHSRN